MSCSEGNFYGTHIETQEQLQDLLGMKLLWNMYRYTTIVAELVVREVPVKHIGTRTKSGNL